MEATDRDQPYTPNSAPLKVRLTALVLLALSGLLLAWLYGKWETRANRSPHSPVVWSLTTPMAVNAQALVQLSGSSFWSRYHAIKILAPATIAAQSAPVQLEAEDTLIRLAPQSIIHLGGDGLPPRLLRGSAQVIKAKTTTHLQVANDGVQVLELAESQRLLPEAGSIIDFAAGTGSVEIRVHPTLLAETAQSGSRLSLEFAREPEFRAVLFSESLEAGRRSVPFADRARGAWFVRAVDSSERTLAVTHFYTADSREPDLLRMEGARWLTWRDRQQAPRFRIELASDESFAKVATSFVQAHRPFDLTQLSAGPWFARVVALAHDDRETASHALAIRVRSKDEILRASSSDVDPALALAARGWRILLTDDEMQRVREGYAILHASELNGIRAGDGIPSALVSAQAVFEVSSDQSFSNPERVRVGRGGELRPPALPLGVLYARLRRLEPDGSLGAFGPASRLTTLLPAPKVKPTRTLADGGFALAWTMGIPVSGFEIRTSPDAKFPTDTTTVIHAESAAHVINDSELDGFFWTVAATDERGQIISQVSSMQEARRIRVLEAVRVAGPSARKPTVREPLGIELLAPADDAVVVAGLRDKVYGRLKWVANGRAPAAAGTYELQLASDGDFVNLVAKTRTAKPEFRLEGDLPEGSLFWRVRSAALAGKAAGPWSSTRRFELVYE